MTTQFDFDRRLTDFLQEAAAPRVPDYFDELLDRTKRTRQRPAWASVERWLPMQLTMRRSQLGAVPRLVLLLLIAVLVAALLAVALNAGTHRLPPPIGPAGNGLVATDANGTISVSSVDGTGVRALTPPSEVDISPAWTADGTRLAFYSFPVRSGVDPSVAAGPPLYDSPDQPDGTVVVMNADGSDRRELVHGLRFATQGHLWLLNWSHDGRKLAIPFDENGVPAFEIFDLVDGRVDAFHDAATPLFSPDDRLLSFSKPTVGVFVAPTDPSAPSRQISDVSGSGLAFSGAVWRPDGTRLAFYAGPDGGHDVYTVGPDGSDQQRISSLPADEYNPAWSPDGSWLAYQRDQDGNNDDHDVVVNADGSNERELQTTLLAAGVISWSPDGRFLVGLTVKPDLSAADTVLLIDVAAPDRSVRVPETTGISWQRVAP
jgi:WD40 repeat protein